MSVVVTVCDTECVCDTARCVRVSVTYYIGVSVCVCCSNCNQYCVYAEQIGVTVNGVWLGVKGRHMAMSAKVSCSLVLGIRVKMG